MKSAQHGKNICYVYSRSISRYESHNLGRETGGKEITARSVREEIEFSYLLRLSAAMMQDEFKYKEMKFA